MDNLTAVDVSQYIHINTYIYIGITCDRTEKRLATLPVWFSCLRFLCKVLAERMMFVVLVAVVVAVAAAVEAAAPSSAAVWTRVG